ncbi:MAG: ABC transporter ATP-binding protein [Desulfobacterales bacterium]|nr:ABC transporter ATP-binding protein [Desulfobacterales bacterium]
MLDVSNLNTFYGQFQALHDLSLTVEDGQMVALFGPNGHGKSTLLKTICGLIEASSGSIKWNNTELAGLSSEKIVQMGVIYIAEDRHLFPEMTVMQNLKMGAFNLSARSSEAETLAYVLDIFPKLKILRNKPASTLSGGEARMLAIGRGIMSKPKFLAIDEPSIGLSPKLREEVFLKINEIRQSGVSILLVEQSSEEVAEMADYLYLMEDGHIVFKGHTNDALKDENIKKIFLGTG